MEDSLKTLLSCWWFLKQPSKRCRKVCPGWYRLGLPHISRIFAYVCPLFGGCYMAVSQNLVPRCRAPQTRWFRWLWMFIPTHVGNNRFCRFAPSPYTSDFQVFSFPIYLGIAMLLVHPVWRITWAQRPPASTVPPIGTPMPPSPSFPVHWLVKNGIPRSWIII